MMYNMFREIEEMDEAELAIMEDDLAMEEEVVMNEFDEDAYQDLWDLRGTY